VAAPFFDTHSAISDGEALIRNTPLSGRFALLAEREGLIRVILGPHPFGAAAPSWSAFLPISRTLRSHPVPSLHHIRKTPLAGRFAYLAE
jgi:hypothetical protein